MFSGNSATAVSLEKPKPSPPSSPRPPTRAEFGVRQLAAAFPTASANKRHAHSTIFTRNFRSRRSSPRSLLREALLLPASQNVPAQSRPPFRNRLADRPDAVPLLVEHLVRPPASRQTNHRIPPG